MKKIFTLIAAAMVAVGAMAQKTEKYVYDGSEVAEGGGTKVELSAITMTYVMGEDASDKTYTPGEAAATATNLAGEEMAFTHYIQAKATNGRTNVLTNRNCAYYQFEPKFDGTLQVMVTNVAANKEVCAGEIVDGVLTPLPVKIFVDGAWMDIAANTKLEAYNIEKYEGFVNIEVKSGLTYTYCLGGSKGRIMGFSYTYTESAGGGDTPSTPAKADYEIFTETVDEAGVKHYTMPTAMADLQAATGLPKTSWGIGIEVPAGKTIIATSEFEVYAPTGHVVNVFDQWGMMGDCPIEGLANYINVGVNDSNNQWGDDAVILDIEAIARAGQTVLEVNAKANGKFGANVIVGANNRSVGIYKVPTEEEMNNDNFGGFVANIKCDYKDLPKAQTVTNVSCDVEAGRQYWIIASRENQNLYEMTFAAGATGIEGVTSNVEKKIVAVYNLNGVRVNAPVKGLNIVKYSDGSTVKVIK